MLLLLLRCRAAAPCGGVREQRAHVRGLGQRQQIVIHANMHLTGLAFVLIAHLGWPQRCKK